MPSVAHEQIVALIQGGLSLEELSVAEQRAAMEASADMFPVEPDVLTVEVDADGVPADWVSVADEKPERVVLYLR